MKIDIMSPPNTAFTPKSIYIYMGKYNQENKVSVEKQVELNVASTFYYQTIFLSFLVKNKLPKINNNKKRNK